MPADDLPPEPDLVPDGYPSFPLASRRRRLPEAGTLEVFVADEQTAEPVEGGRWGRLAERVLDAEGISGDAELSLLFVDEVAIAELNHRFMGVDGPTDVLAFPLEDDLVGMGRWPDSGTPGPMGNRSEPSDPPLLLGDVVICPAVAARNAPNHAGTYEDELALLVVHGTLHVLGLDHAEPAEELAMQAKERDLLARFHRSP
ncbi:MAG: rRNA maturation RNase YbeY [Acidimicrobiales bacterium]